MNKDLYEDRKRALEEAGALARDDDGDGVSEDGGDCDDDDPGVHSGADETWEDGFTDNDCDGEIESGVLEYGADVISGEAAGGQFGRRVSSIGEVDGDGVSSFVVGAPYLSLHAEYAGAVYLADGSAEDASELPKLYSTTAYDFLGTVAGGADIDDDGWPDLIAAATGRDGGTGAVWIVSGADLAEIDEEPIEEMALARVDGAGAGSYLGSDASVLGDLDGDGSEEWGLTAPFASTGSLAEAGAVGTWSASSLLLGGTLEDADTLVEGWYAGAQYGTVVRAATDLDGDGYDDFMIGVGSGELAVVLPGGQQDLSAEDDPLFRLTAESEGETCTPRMLGDLDGDGSADLGCIYDYDTVLIYTSLLGAPARTTGDPTARVDAGDGSYMFDLLDLGDLDGDGRAETLVPAQTHGTLDTAVLGILPGRETDFGEEILLDELFLRAISSRPYSAFGYRTSSVGDTDRDGRPEVLLGGYSDDGAGDDARAIVLLPLPQ